MTVLTERDLRGKAMWLDEISGFVTVEGYEGVFVRIPCNKPLLAQIKYPPISPESKKFRE